MKNTFKYISLLGITVFLFLSCTGEETYREGTCETKTISNSGTNTFYTCLEGDDQYCDGPSEASEAGDVAFAFHEGKVCTDLGYGYEVSDNRWIYEEGNNTTPGPYGAFAND